MRSAIAGLVLLLLSSASGMAQEDLTPQEKQRLERQQQRREEQAKQQTPADAAAAKPTAQSSAPAAQVTPLTVEQRRRQRQEAQAASTGQAQQEAPEGIPQRPHQPQAPRDSVNAPPPSLDQQTDAQRAAARERRRQERLRQQKTPTGPTAAPKGRPLAEGSPPPGGPARANRPLHTDRPDRMRPPAGSTGAIPSQSPPLEFHRRADRTPGEVNRPAAAPQMPDRLRRVGPSLPTRPHRAEASSDRGRGQARAPRDFRFDATRSLELRRGAQARALAQPSRSFRLGQSTYRVVRAERYRYAPGYHYRVFRRGQRFPAALLAATYFLNNFTDYDLARPPVGYRWVRFGPDALLIDLRTFEVSRTRYGVFYEGSEPSESFGYDPEDRDLPPIDPRLPEAFLSGELGLSSGDYGGGCDDFYGQQEWRDYVDRAWADEDWNELAGVVIDGACESDLSYFLLGMAAEGLALPDAAASYYQRALDLYDDAGWNNCDAWDQDACRGVDVGDEAAQALERLYSEAGRPDGYR